MKSIRPVYALLLLTMLIASMMLVYVKVSSVSSPTIYLEIPATIEVCENFTVNLNVANVSDLVAWELRLQWNPAFMQLLNVTEGPFLESVNSSAWGEANNEEGWALAAGYNDDDISLPGVNGSGTLANLTFHCTGAGVTILNLSETMLFNSSTQSVPWNGAGDAQVDGEVNVFDLIRVTSAFWSYEGDDNWDENADFNGDGFVGMYDSLCVTFNWGRSSPSPSLLPEQIDHIAINGLVTQSPSPSQFSITWNWLDAVGDPVWYAVNASFSGPCQIQDFSFNHTLNHLSFNITSATAGVCNVTIPRKVGSYGSCMDGAFKVLVNNNQVACMLTWNQTHTLIQFNYSSGTHSVEIVGQSVTKIKGDITKDGIVDLFDAILLAAHFGWEEP